MKCRCIAVAAALFAALTLRAGAQQQPTAPSHIETVVVTADTKGPAIWHATKDGRDVAILGIVEPLPDGFVWNTKPFETLFDGARLALLPPQVRMGVFSGAWFYLTDGDLLHPPDGKTLWQVLDPAIAADLARTCAFLHEPEDRYGDNSPIFAAMRLGSDFRHVDDLTTHEPGDSIATLARAHHVRVRRIATYDLVPSGEELLKLPSAKTGNCVEAAIQDIGYQSRHVAAVANAWAIGDVPGMMANWMPSHYYACLVRLSSHATNIDARSIDDTVSAIETAIADGGRTVAVVRIDILLRKDGVLDRLKADGASITGP